MKNNKVTILSFIAVLILFVVAFLIYSSDSGLKNRVDRTSDEYANATVVLDIPEGEQGEAPGSCKISLISQSASYPVEIADITEFYEFSDAVADCTGGTLDVYDMTTGEPMSVNYVSISLDNSNEGVTKVDSTTGIAYTVDHTFTENVLNISIAIEEAGEGTDTSDVVRSVLLSEVSAVFYGDGNLELVGQYETLASMGLELNN